MSRKALPGNRTALNLVGVKKEDLDPGDFLVTPGTLEASNRFDAQFTYLPATSTQAKPLESGSTVHVAHGTREVTGRLLLMDGLGELAPGQTAFAQIRLDVPCPFHATTGLSSDHFHQFALLAAEPSLTVFLITERI